MIKNISDILVISDLDNTLLTVENGIHSFNIKMIEKFQQLGGRFTVATGRTIESVTKNIAPVKLNAPIITYNGAIIYDLEKNNVIFKQTLPSTAKDLLKNILDRFPTVGCEIMCDNYRIYIVNPNEYTYQHIVDENLSYVDTCIDSVKNKWVKILFADSNHNLQEIKKYIQTLDIDDMDFVMTNHIYFEIMPKNVSKGDALEKLCTAINIDINNTVAIGDYYNDVEILQKAGLSVCVENAPEDIKKICKAVVPSCKEGGVGYLLQKIINTYSK